MNSCAFLNISLCMFFEVCAQVQTVKDRDTDRKDKNHGMHIIERFYMHMHTNIEVVKGVQAVMDDRGNTFIFAGN